MQLSGHASFLARDGRFISSGEGTHLNYVRLYIS